MNMDYSYEQGLERRLHKLDKQNMSLIQENNRLRQTVQQLTHQLKGTSDSNLNKFISAIEQNMNHQGSNIKLEELEHHIRSLVFQVARYKAINRDLQIVAADANQRLSHILVQQADNQREISCLKHRIEQNAVKEECHLKRITFISDKNKRIDDEKRQLRKQKDELQVLLQEQSKKNQQILVQLAESLRFFTKMSKMTSENNGGNFQQLQSVIDLQQQQLEQRNNELHKLRSVCQGQKRLPQQDNLRNTIKHLKLEINKYKNIVKDYTLKMSFTQKIINKYSMAAQNCQREIQASARLEEDLKKQRLENQKLTKDIHECYGQILQKEQVNRQLKSKIVQILIQNQACHYILFEKFGQNHRQMLDHYRQKQKFKLQQKGQSEKWCDVQELIKANLLLRQRLKI